MIESNKMLQPWRDSIVYAAQQAVEAPMVGPVHAILVFAFPHLKSHYTSKGALRPSAPSAPATRPDLDKLCRAVLDALTQAGAWQDDGQVVSLCAIKMYAPRPGLQVSLLCDQE